MTYLGLEVDPLSVLEPADRRFRGSDRRAPEREVVAGPEDQLFAEEVGSKEVDARRNDVRNFEPESVVVASDVSGHNSSAQESSRMPPRNFPDPNFRKDRMFRRTFDLLEVVFVEAEAEKVPLELWSLNFMWATRIRFCKVCYLNPYLRKLRLFKLDSNDLHN